MKRALISLSLMTSLGAGRADVLISSWTPLFKGIDQAVGTNRPNTVFTNRGVIYTNTRLQVAHCVRVDLADPDVRLLATPPAPSPVPESRETLSLSIATFLRNYGLQAAINAGFYNANPGGSDPGSEGVSCEVYGLQICAGAVVSAADTAGRYASILFTTNKQPSYVFNNQPPGTNTAGIYTAITGYYPILSNGVNIGPDSLISVPDSYVHQAHPRSLIGTSQDRRYLYMMTIDGRQGGYSDGALDVESGYWLLRFGAWDAINLDGGNSTAMYVANASGNPLALNHSSYVSSGRERYIGSHFGVFAARLSPFITNLVVVPGIVNATIAWTTFSNATSQVEYGLTTNYGAFSVLDPTLVTNHSVTLTNLIAGSPYFFRVRSKVGTNEYMAASQFQTRDLIGVITVLPASVDASITWATSWEATSQVEYGLTTNYGSFSVLDPTPVTNHSVILTDLLAGSPYFFRVRSKVGTNEYMAVSQFQTRDLIGVITALPGTVDASITWATSWEATSQVEYGLTTNYGSFSVLDPTPVTNHSVILADLTAGSTYFFRVRSKVGINEYVAASQFQTRGLINDIATVPGFVSATVTWTTSAAGTSQVEYGLTTSYGTFSGFDPTLGTNHSMILTGLAPGSTYYFRVISRVESNEYSAVASFQTLPLPVGLIFDVTNSWKYSVSNFDGINWTALGFDDSNWPGGPGFLWADSRGANATIPLETTQMPTNPVGGWPFPTYYLRTHFNFGQNPVGATLTFSNYLDDGAVFYLNGVEIYRAFMAPSPTVISNADVSISYYCRDTGNATCPFVFSITGDLLTNLLVGDNVLAVEMHNYKLNSPDVTFGAALLYAALPLPVNQPPVAYDRGLLTPQDQPISLTRAQLLVGDYDPDGDPLSLTVNPVSAQGGVVSLTSTNVTYQPPLRFTGLDSFDYSLADGRGGVATAAVQIRVVSGAVPPPNHVAITLVSGGSSLRFSGDSGARYTVQRSTDLTAWTTLDTLTMPLYGLLEYEDLHALSGAVFYRVSRLTAGP